MEKIKESNWSKATKENLSQEGRNKLMKKTREKLAQEQENLKKKLKKSSRCDEDKKQLK